MSKAIFVAALAALFWTVTPLAASADSGHGDKEQEASEGGHAAGHGEAAPQAESLAAAWSALTMARDSIADDVESGALGEIHAKTEPLPEFVAALLEHSGDLDAGKRTRVEGAAKQIARVAGALHVAADGGDAERTRKELSRLDGLLQLIRAQYPEGTLDAKSVGHGDHGAASGHGHGAHAHGEAPLGVVDSPPQATLVIEALDPLRFEPMRIEVQAGVPTRLVLENRGDIEHSFVVKTPSGEQDWIHLHAAAGATEAATYRLDAPGTYAVLCTIPGHTEGGMTGELVVLASDHSAPSHH